MAFGAITSGTQTATVGTTHDLSTQTGTNIFVLHVDLGPMTNGNSTDAADEVELTIQTKCLSSGTERIVYTAVFKGAQQQPQAYSIPIPSDVSCKFQLKQAAGVSRDFPWKIYGLT